LGAIAGISLCLWLTTGVYPPAPESANNWLRAATQETVGTFGYVFFFISQSENKEVVSDIETIQCFTLAASFLAGRGIVLGNKKGSHIMNPAIAFALFLFGLFEDAAVAFKWIWLYPVCPFIGAIFSVMFFEFVYKKAVDGNTDNPENAKGLVHEDAQQQDY
jgi:glycerol uptake facilitator-like aquaporin